MNFLISDTFTDSLARLTGDEQKAVKTTAFDRQMNPAGNGMSFHRLDKAKDKNFWSVRVNGDIRHLPQRNHPPDGRDRRSHRNPRRLVRCVPNPKRVA